MLTAHASCGRTLRDRANYAVPASGGAPEKLCDECGWPWDWSADHTRILHYGFKSSVVASMTNLETGTRSLFLESPGKSLYHFRWSPDSRWIVFQAESRTVRRSRPVRRSLYRRRGAERDRVDPDHGRLDKGRITRVVARRELDLRALQPGRLRLHLGQSCRSPNQAAEWTSGRCLSLAWLAAVAAQREPDLAGACPSPGTESCSIKARSPATSG